MEKGKITDFQFSVIEALREMALQERWLIDVNDINSREIEITVGDLTIFCFPEQVDIKAKYLYRRFEKWRDKNHLELIQEIVSNVSFYLKNPGERDIPSVGRPDLFFSVAIWQVGSTSCAPS